MRRTTPVWLPAGAVAMGAAGSAIGTSIRGGVAGAPRGAGAASTGGWTPPWAKAGPAGRLAARTPEAAKAKLETSEAP
jgi:hypothetical protein